MFHITCTVIELKKLLIRLMVLRSKIYNSILLIFSQIAQNNIILSMDIPIMVYNLIKMLIL